MSGSDSRLGEEFNSPNRDNFYQEFTDKLYSIYDESEENIHVFIPKTVELVMYLMDKMTEVTVALALGDEPN